LVKESIVKIYAPKSAANSILEYCERDLELTPEDSAYAAAIVLRSLTRDSGLAQHILDDICNAADRPKANGVTQ